jgi:hypothetical protein
MSLRSIRARADPAALLLEANLQLKMALFAAAPAQHICWALSLMILIMAGPQNAIQVYSWRAMAILSCDEGKMTAEICDLDVKPLY